MLAWLPKPYNSLRHKGKVPESQWLHLVLQTAHKIPDTLLLSKIKVQ